MRRFSLSFDDLHYEWMEGWMHTLENASSVKKRKTLAMFSE